MFLASQVLAAAKGSPAGSLLFGSQALRALPPHSEQELLRFAARGGGDAAGLGRLALGWRLLSGRGVARDCARAVSQHYLPAAAEALRAASAASRGGGAGVIGAPPFPFVEEVWLWDDWLQGWSRGRQSAAAVAALRAKAVRRKMLTLAPIGHSAARPV
jgi:hypothetical protein